MTTRKCIEARDATLLIAIVLSALGAFFPSEKLIGVAAEDVSDCRELVTGVLLLRFSLIFNGLVLAGIWMLSSNEANGTSAGTPSSGDKSIRREKSIKSWLLLAGIISFGALLRIKGLNSGLWYDEVLTLVEFVRLPLFKLFTSYSDQNNHPLFSFLAHLSTGLFGESAWSLRLPALLFGLASLLALYHLARTITNKREALLSTMLMSVWYHHVWFSQNARGYTGLLFWTLLGTSLFLRGLRGASHGTWGAYAACMALGMYTHLTAAFTFASHVLIYSFLLFRQMVARQGSPGTRWWPIVSFILALLFTFQLYALVIPQVFGAFHGQVGGMRVQEWTNPVWALMETLRMLRLGLGTLIGGLLVLVVFIAGLIDYLRKNRLVVALMVIPAAMGAIPLLVLHRHFYPRFFFPALGFGMLVLIRGTTVIANGIITILWRRSQTERPTEKLGTALSGAIIIACLASLGNLYHYPKQDFPGARTYVENRLQTGDQVLTVGLATYPYEHYYRAGWKSVETLEQLNAARSSAGTTWLLYTFPDHMRSFYPELMAGIVEDFVVVTEFRGTVGGGTVYVCKAEPRPSPR